MNTTEIIIKKATENVDKYGYLIVKKPDNLLKLGKN